MKSGPIGLVVVNRSGRVTNVNVAALKFLGLKSRQVLGREIPKALREWPQSDNSIFSTFDSQNPLTEKRNLFGTVHHNSAETAYFFTDLKSVSDGIDLLARRESMWSYALDSAGMAVWEFDRTQPKGKQAFYSRQWKILRGLDPNLDVVENFEQWLQNIHTEDQERVRQIWDEIQSGHTDEIGYEYRERSVSGEWRWFMARGKVLLRGTNGIALHYIGTDVDISELKHAEAIRARKQYINYAQHMRALEEEKEKAEAAKKLVEQNAYREEIWRSASVAAGHGVWSCKVDQSGDQPVSTMDFVSDIWFKLRGLEVGNLDLHAMADWSAKLHRHDRKAVLKAIDSLNCGECENLSIEYRELKPDGNYVWILARGEVMDRDEQGRPTRVIGTDVDITAVKAEELRRSEEAQFTYQNHLNALHKANLVVEEARREAQLRSQQDTATGLGNRRLCRETVNTYFVEGIDFALLQIDLDRFKQINDLHGHAAGDHVLRTTAYRLKEVVGDNGVCIRLGGDEFAVIMRKQTASIDNEVKLMGGRIISALAQPIVLSDLRLIVGASVGIACAPRDGQNYDTLLHCADMALYVVKTGERGTIHQYDPSLSKAAQEKASLEADLRLAIQEDVIEPWFQPIFSTSHNDLAKLEVLARWKCPVRGFVRPDTFVEVASHIGLMPELTTNVLRKALTAAANWPNIILTFNISAIEACDEATPVRIFSALMKADFPPERLEIEVTEQALIADFEKAAQVLRALRSAGVKVYIDDFGHGFAGIGYLRKLEVDGIKIDRSCVQDICTDNRSANFLGSLQGMANTLNYETIAEGIETADVWAKVRELGCQFGQGYHLAKPMPAADVDQLVIEYRPASNAQLLSFSRP